MNKFIVEYTSSFSDSKKRMEVGVLEICNAVVRFSNITISKEYRKILKNENVDKEVVIKYLNDIYDDNFESYDISYVVQNHFQEAMEIYALLIWVNCLTNSGMESQVCIFNFLKKIIDVLEERKYILNKTKDVLFERFVGDSFYQSIFNILELCCKEQEFENELEELQKQVDGLY